MNTRVVPVALVKSEKIEYFGVHYTIRLTRDPADGSLEIVVENDSKVSERHYPIASKNLKDDFPFFYGQANVEALPDKVRYDIVNGIV